MEQERVRVKFRDVFMHQHEKTQQHFVLFEDDEGRRMPIWIGQSEAWGIAVGREDEPPLDRPFTHDAMVLILAATGASMEEAYI